MSGFDLYTVGWSLMSLEVVMLIAVGVMLGIIVGALPGLSGLMAVSVLIPVSYPLELVEGLAMLLGVYCGANFGGSISACLINIPGTSAAIMTVLDGYPLAKRGEAGKAIGLAALTSTIGGIFSIVALSAFSPMLARIALNFRSLELVTVAIFGLSVVAYVSEGSTLKGLISAFLGLILVTVGYDSPTAIQRFTFGSINLLSGIQFIPAMIGLFGLAEMLSMIGQGSSEKTKERFVIQRMMDSFAPLKRLWGIIMRSSVIGVIIGAIPGAGSTISAIVSYGVQKRISKKPEEFGKGSLEGIAAAESSNNATTGGALIPLLSLGIPGDAVTAVLVGAFIYHGIVPGPMLFKSNPQVVSAIFISLLVANIAMLILGITCSRYFALLLTVPRSILNTVIIALCVIGTYSISNTLFDAATMVAFGVLGFIFTKLDIPRAPMVLAMILGPLLEENLRRWSNIADGKYLATLVETLAVNQISLIMVVLTVLILCAPMLKNLYSIFTRRQKNGEFSNN
jgi:putative tricarboxylic transport membrane protein